METFWKSSTCPQTLMTMMARERNQSAKHNAIIIIITNFHNYCIYSNTHRHTLSMNKITQTINYIPKTKSILTASFYHCCPPPRALLL